VLLTYALTSQYNYINIWTRKWVLLSCQIFCKIFNKSFCFSYIAYNIYYSIIVAQTSAISLVFKMYFYIIRILV